jgi:hypothetical protein
MRTVWKYQLDVGRNLLEVPRNPKWLAVGQQNGRMMVWVEVDDEANEVTYELQVVGTGCVAPSAGRYIGTVQTPPYVRHVYGMT